MLTMISRRSAQLIMFLMAAISVQAQTVSLMPFTRSQWLDGSGHPLAGAHLFSYTAGTSSPLPTYTDSTGLVANANPIILDAAGRADVWLSTGVAYKLVMQDANFITIFSEDNITAPSGGNNHIFQVIPLGGVVGELRFLAGSGSNYVGFKAPSGITSSIVWELPGADGVAGACLVTDGGGVLSWSSSCGGSGSGFVTLTTNQSISGIKTFTVNQLFGNGVALRPLTSGGANLGSNAAHWGTIWSDFVVGHFLEAKSLSGAIGELRLSDLAGSFDAGFKAPDVLGGDLIWTLPSSDGTANQCLKTNGVGILSFSSCGGGGGGNPFSDANPLIFNDADSSKQIIVSASVVSSGTTVTLSAQDGDYSIAGENINNHFTGTQSFGSVTYGGVAAVTIGTTNMRPIASGSYNLGSSAAKFGSIFVDTTATNNLRVLPISSVVGEADFFSPDGSSWVGFKASNSLVGSVVWTLPVSDGNNGDCLITNGFAVLSWSSSCSGGGGGLPVVDTTAIVKGSVDATKLLRFEVDGFTTSTTRTLTPPDANVTIAGLENNPAFTNGITLNNSNINLTGTVQIGSAVGTHVNSAFFDSLSIYGSSFVKSGGTWTQQAGSIWNVSADMTYPVDNTYSIGSLSFRPNTIYTRNMVVSGTCLGCGAGVTSVSTASPITGGTITTTGTISCPTCMDTTSSQSISGIKTYTINQLYGSGANLRPTVSGGANLGSSAAHWGSGWIDNFVGQTVQATASYVAPNGLPGLSTTFQLMVAPSVCQQFTFSGGIWTSAGSTYAC